MEQVFLSKVLLWLPQIYFAVILLFVAWRYFVKSGFPRYGVLVRGVIWFRLGYAVLLTIGQYYIWSKEVFLRLLLNTPLSESLPIPLVQKFPEIFNSKIGYFLFYSWGHFWLNFILTIGIAWLFYRFLLVLQRWNSRFFDEGEVKLGFVCALVAGWPGVLVFIALTFAIVILLAMARAIVLHEGYTTLGVPLLLAAAIALWMSSDILSFFNLRLYV
ncbi:MAG: hypothetical protein AAB503_01180 [Patescibacteria group bacterium]